MLARGTALKSSIYTSPDQIPLLNVGYFRTSGARISVIEVCSSPAGYEEIHTDSLLWDGSYDDADSWVGAVEKLLYDASTQLGGLGSVVSICVSGTSASCLIVDRNSKEWSRRPRMYDYDVMDRASDATASQRAVALLEKHAPPRHTARARTGSLAKLLAWAIESPMKPSEVMCHQSDYISMRLMTDSDVVRSDWHNCLKLGWDVRNGVWPDWLGNCLAEAGIDDALGGAGKIPLDVVSPGSPMGVISKETAEKFGLGYGTAVVGGTTDSNAAFFAAAGTRLEYGTAVTSLGSTLAIKQLSRSYVEDASLGVYSHRFPTLNHCSEDAWLVGGASNVGCAILRKLKFSNDELASLSAKIDPLDDSPLSYYPLVKPGERFPVADANKQPILDPVPENRAEYLHGILQAISDVERDGFGTLQRLGAPPLTTVWTCGGGSRNEMWGKMRERRLRSKFGGTGIKVQKAACSEASYGAALLAAATFT